jgi:hypothetical protein
MLRSSCAGIIAIVAWFLAASVGNRLMRAVLPGYAEVEAAMTFTLVMQVCRLVLGLVSSLCAGFVCAAIAGPKRTAEKVVACGLVLLFLPVHYSLWDKFPVWYHIFFLVTLAPAVLAGAALYSKCVGRESRVAAQ